MGLQFLPPLNKVKKEVAYHLEKNKNLANIFEVYQSVLAVQTDYLTKIDMPSTPPKEEIEENFRQGIYLLSEQQLPVEPGLFREIAVEICRAIKESSPEAPEALLTLLESGHFKEPNLKDLIHKAAASDSQQLESYIKKNKIDEAAGLDSEVLAYIVFASLTPFFIKYLQAVREVTDFSLWRHGFCPVCGQTAMIAKHREKDGARILGCWLCHAEWYFPRMECPYCDNKDPQKLRFFYVPGDKARQVHICEECKKYLKTIDGKMLERDVLLEVEAIATGHLDALAKREGYLLPAETSSLN